MVEHRDPMKPFFAVWMIGNGDGSLDTQAATPDCFDSLEDAIAFSQDQLKELSGGRYLVCTVEPHWIVEPLPVVHAVPKEPRSIAEDSNKHALADGETPLIGHYMLEVDGNMLADEYDTEEAATEAAKRLAGVGRPSIVVMRVEDVV
jgi:hypothetical protein